MGIDRRIFEFAGRHAVSDADPALRFRVMRNLAVLRFLCFFVVAFTLPQDLLIVTARIVLACLLLQATFEVVVTQRKIQNPPDASDMQWIAQTSIEHGRTARLLGLAMACLLVTFSLVWLFSSLGLPEETAAAISMTFQGLGFGLMSAFWYVHGSIRR